MPAKKRAPEDTESTTSRPAKAQKTASGKKAKAAAKPAMPVSEFKHKARPLHIHITHTPPSIEAKEPAKPGDGAEGTSSDAIPDPTSPEAPIDPGLISSLTLLPSSFTTGSYGWKGSKKIVVELQNSEDGPNGREKVQVMLTINATVVGSKQSAETEHDGEEEGKDD